MRAISLWRTCRPWLPGIPAILFLLAFFIVPVLEILVNSFSDGQGGWGLSQYVRIGQQPAYLRVLGVTLMIAALTALLSVALAYPFAYLLSQITAKQRGRWLIWLLIPFWTSYLVKTFAWILLLSRTGVLRSLSEAIGAGEITTSLIPSLGGVLVGMVHAMVPLAVMSMLPIMQGIDSQLSRAAHTLGAGRRTAFFTIFMPLSMSGAAAAGLLVFITSLGFFIVPALLGTPRETMVGQLVISVILELFDMPFAGALSVLLLLVTIVVFVGYDRLVGLSSMSGDAPASRGGSPRMQAFWGALGRWADQLLPAAKRGAAKRRPWTLHLYSAIVALFLMLPVLTVVPISFTSSNFLAFPPQGFSLRWYETFMSSEAWQAAFLRSVLVATATALIAVALGLGAALMLAKLRGRAGNALFSFFVAPLILPRIVIAVGLFYLFARLGLTGTDLGLVLGHTVLAIPYVVVTMAAALKRYDWRLDDAAKILGAGSAARLRTVMLPILLPSMASAFLFAFLTSFDELTIAIFVSGGLKTTLPKQMWDDMLLQVNPTLAAVSTTLLVIITLIILAMAMLRRERKNHA
jgi:ABC-type spermidine/putrescine transport system permease subunit II